VNNLPYFGLANSIFSFYVGESRKLAVLLDSESWLDLSSYIFISGE